jgi:hypothetical protein
MSLRHVVFALALLFALLPAPASAADPDADRLAQRLQGIDTDPVLNAHAAYERLQARQAIQDLRTARRKQRPQALAIARLRVETADIAARAEAGRAELQRLELERSELLVEASRRDAERARAEAERMRVEAQIQAEEAARLRAAVEAEARTRQEVEGLLDAVAADEAEKLRQAREREAQLGTPATPAPAPKPAPKPKPRRR